MCVCECVCARPKTFMVRVRNVKMRTFIFRWLRRGVGREDIESNIRCMRWCFTTIVRAAVATSCSFHRWRGVAIQTKSFRSRPFCTRVAVYRVNATTCTNYLPRCCVCPVFGSIENRVCDVIGSVKRGTRLLITPRARRPPRTRRYDTWLSTLRDREKKREINR